MLFVSNSFTINRSFGLTHPLLEGTSYQASEEVSLAEVFLHASMKPSEDKKDCFTIREPSLKLNVRPENPPGGPWEPLLKINFLLMMALTADRSAVGGKRKRSWSQNSCQLRKTTTQEICTFKIKAGGWLFH